MDLRSAWWRHRPTVSGPSPASLSRYHPPAHPRPPTDRPTPVRPAAWPRPNEVNTHSRTAVRSAPLGRAG